MDRREFLLGAVAVGALPTTTPLPGDPPLGRTGLPSIKEYRTLGRTGFEASDIGCGAPQEEGVLNALLTEGVNYIDTGESYSNGASERLAGRVIKGFDRKTLFITTKLILTGNETAEQIKDRGLRCLERLDSGHIDCLMIHAASARVEVKNAAFHEATAQLKQEGKLRYVGISCHGTSWYDEPVDSMEDVLGAAIEDGRFDVLLLAYNYLQREMGERVLRAAREKEVGTTLMKTDPFGFGAFTYFNDLYTEREEQGQEAPGWIKTLREKYARQREEAAPFLERHNLTTPSQIRDAAVRFVLTNQDAHSVAISFKNFDDVEAYLKLSGSRFTEADGSLLASHAETEGRLYCRHACNTCEAHCPSRVPVNTIMRYNHYYVAQGKEKRALELYGALDGPKAEQCSSCEGHCQAACPFSVPIHDLMQFAHGNLTLA